MYFIYINFVLRHRSAALLALFDMVFVFANVFSTLCFMYSSFMLRVCKCYNCSNYVPGLPFISAYVFAICFTQMLLHVACCKCV